MFLISLLCSCVAPDTTRCDHMTFNVNRCQHFLSYRNILMVVVWGFIMVYAVFAGSFLTEISKSSTRIRAWINKSIYIKLWDTIAYPCHNPKVWLNHRWNSGLDERSLTIQNYAYNYVSMGFLPREYIVILGYLPQGSETNILVVR